MSQSPITVNYTIEQVLIKLDQRLDKIEDKLDQRLDKIEDKLDQRLDKIEDKIDNLQKDVTDLKIGQARLEEKADSLNKRLEFQEFINKGVLVGLVVAILGGAAKLFGWIGNP